jgi:hypothetical protein
MDQDHRSTIQAVDSSQKLARIGRSVGKASGKPGILVRFLALQVPHVKGILVILGQRAQLAFSSRVKATPMRLAGTNSLQGLLAICLMSGLVACGSFANCFNSGFVPAACGGGYSESDVSSLPPPTASSAEGRWTGTTLTGRTVAGLVLDDGSYWLFYTARDNSHVLAGLIHGMGTSHAGSFGSSNTRDFNLEGTGIRAATMHGSYVPNKRFQGTIAYFTGDTESFTSTYDPDSEVAPNLNLVAGTYAGLRTDNHTITVTVDSAGTLSGHSTDGCTVVGTLSPRAKENVFNITVTFEGGACRQRTETLMGVAFDDPATNRLYSAALNSARTASFLFLGTKR